MNQISGYRALRMQELGLDEGSDSGSIKASAVQRKALILTFDGDFLDQNTFKICTHPGVLRLSMNSQATSYILPRLTQFLWSTDYKRCRHSIVELRDQVAIVRSKQGLQRPIRYWY